MKATNLRAVDMVRRIRDSQTRELARKSPEAILEYYRAAGARAAALATPRKAAQVAADQALQPTTGARRAGTSARRSRASRG